MLVEFALYMVVLEFEFKRWFSMFYDDALGIKKITT